MPRRLLVLGVVALVVALGAVVLLQLASESSLERADRLVDDPANFATGLQAGDTLAQVSHALLDHADGCDLDETECEALHTAAAFAQVLAARVLLCTAPGRAEARAKMDEVLVSVDAGEVPALPQLPVCG